MKKTGDEYFDSEEFRNLLDGYEESVKSGHPVFMDADDLADIADYYHFMGANQDADETIDYALSLYPNATLPNVFRAREALTAGDIDKAKECVEQIENKEDPEYQYMQAELLIAQDKVEEADKFLRQYFSTIPPDEYQDFVMDVSNIYNDYGLNDKAYEWMMRTKGDDSNDFKELMARTLFGLGKYKDSERIFNELLDKNPYSTRYWNALASAQFMNEDFSNAITSSEYAIAIDPKNPEGLLSKANGLYQLGNYEEAILYYNRYLEVAQPDDIVPQIYQELSLCHSSLHHLDEALAYIDKIQGANSDPTDMLVMKGHIYLENDNVPEAERMFKEAITRSHNAPIILLRIIVSLYDNRYVKACYEMFKKFFSIVVDEHFKQGYSYMALCCWDLGYTEEFLKYLHIAVERNPAETRIVLRHLFPEGMAVKNYYDFMCQKLKQ